ncbi:MAG: ChrR family anti-sigma-E factor [Alphaproteobacteria bacterium]|jgi:putative transcriptional regulator
MSIRHHLTDELLLAYAAGNLAESWSLAVASHLSLCPVCREKEARFALIGGAALESIGGTAMGNSALADCLARLDGEVPEPLPAARDQPASASLPKPLRDYAGGDLDAVRWSMVGGGVHQRTLLVGNIGQARLLRIKAGEAVPEHGHRGLELTLVLAGSFADGDTEFRRGDIEVADEEVQHTPIAGYGEPCICLAVTDAPLVFRALLPRIVQRFAKI